MRNSIFLTIYFFLNSLVLSQVLLETDFGNGGLPTGWYFDPVPPYSPANRGEWTVSSSSSSYNNEPPSATYNWNPASSSGFADYSEHYLYSEIITVSDPTYALVQFQIALDGYTTPPNHYNGLKAEYSSDGNSWFTVLEYQISNASGATVDILPRTDDFYVTMDNTLQIRWETYGTNSYHIDRWHIDNVKVTAIPSIAQDGSATISSNNSDDSQKAIPGDIITLAFTVPVALASGSEPFVLINSTEASVSNVSGLDYIAEYTVPAEATDGPISFSIDFTTGSNIPGPTCRKTTDNSNVLVDVTGPVSPNVTVNTTASGGNVFSGIWNTTNENIQVEVDVPSDTTVVAFNYEVGQSASLIGTNGILSIPSNSAYSVSNEFTFETYIKVNSAGDYQGFLDFGQYGSSQKGFGAFLYGGGWRFFLKTTGSASFSDIQHLQASAPIDTWVHFAITLENNIFKLFRNGILIGSKDGYPGNVDWGSFSDNLILGSFDSGSGTNYFDGKIDEVRFWNIARTENEIKAYKNVGLNGDETGLIGYWRIDETSGAGVADLSSINNSGTINGGASFTQDSYFLFQEDSLNTLSIIGSKFQMLGKVSGNSYELLGDKITITSDDLAVQKMVLSVTADQFQALTGFDHNLNTEFSARLFDQSGNSADGNTSATIINIDIIAGPPSAVSILSNNTYSHLAKTGDQITLNMSFPEDVNLPEVLIEGNASTESDLGGESFKSVYILDGTESEGDIEVSFTVLDYLGNQNQYTSITDGSNVYYDKTKPSLDLVRIASDNPHDSTWATISNTISLYFTADEDISNTDSVPSATIMGQNTTLSVTGANSRKANYVTTSTDPEGETNFQITIFDLAGNKGDVISVSTSDNNSKVIYDRTAPSDFTLGAVISSGGNIIENVWNLTNIGLEIIVPIENDTTLKNGWVQTRAKIGSNSFENLGTTSSIAQENIGGTKILIYDATQIESITGFAENETITLDAILYDRPGNMKNGIESINILEIDQIPASIFYRSYKSNFSDTTLAAVGDQILLEIKSNEAIQEPSITIASNPAAVVDNGGNNWSASYTMQDGDSDGIIPFEIGVVTDSKGNPNSGVISTTTNSSVVIFDNTKPLLNIVRIISNNSDSTWAKIGDSISVTFKSNELLTQSSASISIESAELTLLSSQKYVAKYLMQSLDAEGDIPFAINFTDSVGLSGDPVSETTNNSNVIFDKTAPILDYVHIESNNANNTLIAITGDDVFLTFRPINTDPIITNSILVTIGGQTALLSQSGDDYVATITIDGSIPGGFLSYTIDFVDRASNPGEQVIVTTDNSYVNHDIVPPSIDSVLIYSSNFDPNWAKVNDTVFVEFFANEQLGSMNINISGTDFTQYTFEGLNENNLAKYLGFKIMDETDSEGVISFNIDYQDLGGVTGSPKSQTTNNSEVKFDKTLPVLSNIRMASNNSINDSLAGIDDIDTLFFTSSEIYRDLQILINESNSNPVNETGLSYYAIKNMIESDPDGLITFQITLDDSAGNSSGNISETSDGSTVLYDGTPPNLNIVSFKSTNSVSPELAITGDTLILDYVSGEILSLSTVTIAGAPADTIFENISREGTSFRSWRVLDGSEGQGFIPFSIQFYDIVGNAGSDISSTTDGTSILFDMTPPSVIELDTVYATGGNVQTGYWNLSNESISLEVLVSGDSTLFDGKIQPLVQFNSNGYNRIGGEFIIESSDSLKILEIPRDSIMQMDQYLEGSDILFKYNIWDKAGNQTEGLTDNTILHIDETPPVVELDTLYSNNDLSIRWATISDSIFLALVSNEGLSNPKTVLFSDTLITNSTDNGKVWLGKNIVEEEDPNGEISFNFIFSDTAGNIGAVLNDGVSSSVSIDKSNPFISDIMVGESNENLLYYNKSDSLTLYWTHLDSLSGIQEVYYGLGSDNNINDIVNWTSASGDNIAGMGNLNLSNEATYYGSVFVRDSAGNYSDTIWSSGITIDTQIPDTGIINDGNWIIELDYTLDSTKLLYTYEGFSDNIDILKYEIAVGTNNDTTNIRDWVSTDSLNQTTISGFDLDRDTLYYSYIRGVDLALNRSEIVKTDGIYFDDSEPKVKRVTPNFIDSLKVLSILRGDTIVIKFNRLIYFYDIELKLNNKIDFQVEEIFSDSAITFTWDEPLSSYDTIIVYLDSALAYNTLFFSDTLYFHSQLWGDLNNDHNLTTEDILIFNQEWPSIDLSPFNNNPPHVRPIPDGEVDLTDMSAFAKMWQWKYFNLSFDSTEFLARTSSNTEIKAKGNNVIFNVPQNTKMIDLLVGESNLSVLEMDILNRNSDSFMFKSVDTLSQIVMFSIAADRGIDSLLILKIPDSDLNNFSCKVQYRFMDENGLTLEYGFNNLNLEILPDKFSVMDNYPNPFNPKTIIQYELPLAENVSIKIYDSLGRIIYKLQQNNLKPGRHQFIWEGVNQFGGRVSTGIYFLQLKAGENVHTQKMMFLK